MIAEHNFIVNMLDSSFKIEKKTQETPCLKMKIMGRIFCFAFKFIDRISL